MENYPATNISYCSVLLGKYARNSTFLDCTALANMSHGWRSVLAGKEILRKGFGWIVGSRNMIRVWRDPWLSCAEPLRPLGPANKDDTELLVSDLLYPLSNTWDRDKIKMFLPQYEDLTCSIVTSSAPSPDHLAWLPDKSGCYTTKTGYDFGMLSTMERNSPLSTFNWTKSIWNIKTSPKVKDFLWKLARKAISVSSNLTSRGIQPFPCKMCDQLEEDLHVFLHCSIAEQVWNLAPLVKIPSNNITAITELISCGPTFTVLPPVGLTVPLWPWIFWNLWKARNKRCFENRTFFRMEIITKAIADAREWQTALPSSPTATEAPPRTNAISPDLTRIAPTTNTMMTCNVDAAWDSRSGNCGSGGVFTGNCSAPATIPDPICASCNHVSSALMAEAIAIRSAVMYAASLNIKSLMLLSDSFSLVKLVKVRDSVPALFDILFDIYHFSSLFDVIFFSYVLRLSNGWLIQWQSQFSHC